ncbi:MAG: TetR/AcrR family transcriptional regulator, partial [Nitrospira sp.]|nr:TetR/AcrR family transcriptional regulator [Nitrospira sp.]
MNKRSGTESKSKIVNAAIKVFSEHGYKGASMRMIAKTADISVGGVYLYFANKEDLYLTIIKEAYGDFAGKVSRALNGAGTSSESINMYISIYINNAKKNRELILIQGREHKFAFGMDIKKKFF